MKAIFIISSACLVSVLTGSVAYAAPPISSSVKYGGSCAYTLASEGRVVQTDCSEKWTGKGGDVYCFATPRAREKFGVGLRKHIEMANEVYDRLNGVVSSKSKDSDAESEPVDSSGAESGRED